MKNFGLRRGVLCLAAAWMVLAGTSTAMAEDIKWDQARAAKLARQLTNEIEEIRRQMSTQPEGAGGITRSRRFRLQDDLRMLRHSTQFLARKLEAGGDREETRPTARRVGSFLRDARANAAGAVATAPMREKIDAANVTIAALAALYGADPTDVALPGGSGSR